MRKIGLFAFFIRVINYGGKNIIAMLAKRCWMFTQLLLKEGGIDYLGK
jgi:hypothetical protein